MILNKKDYVDKAQKVMDKLQKDKSFDLTTTKIRGLLAMTMDIYNEIMPSTEDELSDEINGKINFLKVHVLYEAGRNRKDVKKFVEEAQIIPCIDEIQGSRERYILFSSYMEALVAYFKFNGGRDY